MGNYNRAYWRSLSWLPLFALVQVNPMDRTTEFPFYGYKANFQTSATCLIFIFLTTLLIIDGKKSNQYKQMADLELISPTQFNSRYHWPYGAAIE